MHKIRVSSIEHLIKAKDEINKEPHIIIQIQHLGKNEFKRVDYSNTIRNNTHIFDDVSKGNEGFITWYDASKIITLAFTLPLISDTTIYICCYGGLSRSPAVALAICSILIKEGNEEYCDLFDEIYTLYPHYNTDVFDFITKGCKSCGK